jgi:hypothetical protein
MRTITNETGYLDSKFDKEKKFVKLHSIITNICG